MTRRCRIATSLTCAAGLGALGGASGGTPYPSDKVHFGTQGQIDLGTRMATQIHDKLVLP